MVNTIVAVVTADAAGIFLQGNDDVATHLVVDNALVEIVDQIMPYCCIKVLVNERT